MEDFSMFIDVLELFDLLVVGNKFMWINSNGIFKSIFDRFLISKVLIKEWCVMVHHVGKRDISDHRSIWLRASKTNWGPKPFKVFRCWFDHSGFLDFVSNVWTDVEFMGSSSQVRVKKFKLFRERLRWWNINVFGWVDLKIEEEVDTLNRIKDYMSVSRGVTLEDQLCARSKAQNLIWNNLLRKLCYSRNQG
ncbi:unnamed protein product [Lathyrus sativus]|nr:unnamed protein product [Lathyrus sativus]